MGDNIIDDGDLVITFGRTARQNDGSLNTAIKDKQAGGETGQLIITDVSLTMERDNTNYHGIGNKDPTAMGYGNKTYTLSSESIVNDAIADVVVTWYKNDQTPQDAVLRADGTLEAVIEKVDWNSVDKSATDDGDVTLSIDADARGVTLNKNA
jgi:hypothetical protein